MTQMREAIIFVVGFILLAAAPAQAATIEAKPKSNIIEIKGNIETGDFRALRKIAPSPDLCESDA